MSVAGKEYYHHTRDYFPKLKGKFTDLSLSDNTKRTKRVRKPGDDEFGFQPRLSQRKKDTGKKARKGKKVKKGKGRRAKTKKDDTEKIRSNAGAFLGACDKRPWDPIPHSAKTRATMALVNKW